VECTILFSVQKGFRARHEDTDLQRVSALAYDSYCLVCFEIQALQLRRVVLIYPSVIINLNGRSIIAS
jgi:hypothetical protein